MFAALNTMEPPILELVTARILEGDKPWSKERLPLVKDRIRNRLKQLSVRLGSADWLDGGFSAGDLMMVSVLLRLKPSGMLDEDPNLTAYVARGEAQAAYSGELSPLNWRFTAVRSHRPADGGLSPADENKFLKPTNHFQNRSVGQISVKPPGEKYSDLQNSQISFINTAVLLPEERLGVIVTDAERDAVDADVLLTNSAEADGEVVWS